MLDCNIFPGLGQDYLTTEVNMFLLPVQDNDSDDSLTKAGLDHISRKTELIWFIVDRFSWPLNIVPYLAAGTYPLFSLLPGYKGHPTFSTTVSKLRSRILAMPRCQLSHTILTEKNWYASTFIFLVLTF